jgi:hypothetical protein
MAIAVGFMVAFGVRTLGRGSDGRFAVMFAALALFGCVLGNYLAVCTFAAGDANVSPFTAAIRLLPHATSVMAQSSATGTRSCAARRKHHQRPREPQKPRRSRRSRLGLFHAGRRRRDEAPGGIGE